MTIVTSRLSVSVDGFAAGPNQSLEEPFGEGGMALSNWMLETDQPGRAADAAVIQEANDGVGSHVMGRKMFGGGDGPWDETWTGWWGEEPPYHAPVFVLTRHPRDPLPMKGGTTFTFVTDGIESALDQAHKAAGDKRVAIAGGAGTVNQYLAAGLLDELYSTSFRSPSGWASGSSTASAPSPSSPSRWSLHQPSPTSSTGSSASQGW
jgi:dihydrofolate reductase